MNKQGVDNGISNIMITDGQGETFDPFSIVDLDVSDKVSVHLRLQQRSARKNITILEGLPKDNRKAVIHNLKTRLGCSGTEKNEGELHFSGDQRKKIADYLLEKKIVNKSEITIHGF